MIRLDVTSTLAAGSQAAADSDRIADTSGVVVTEASKNWDQGPVTGQNGFAAYEVD